MSKVLITGATSGIGYATALLFAARGHSIIAIGRNKEALNKLREEIGPGHSFIKFDLTNFEKISLLKKSITNKVGHVDVIINNAGVGVFKPFEEISETEWKKIMDTNFKAPVKLIKAFYEDMKSEGGTIVNITSVAGKRTWKNLTAYSSSKFALVGFTNSLRRECKFHDYPINIINICPPATDTEFFNNAGYPNYKEEHPHQNLLNPNKVAEDIYEAVMKNKREVLVSARAKLLDKVASIFPNFIENLEDSIKGKDCK